ncbi:MAG TPA: hypothetical protein VNP36_03075 [Burkholderiales bacterium]|nr:hypothetical protein [Burkholderiales bacterium]
MNASAIYSKSGKGVQEASGKTSHLARSDRAVLSAIDGRATLADVAQKVGKTFDPGFEKLIESLDKGGFIREVSAGTAGPAPSSGKGAGAGAKPAAAKAAAPVDPVSDLDFTTALSMPRGKPAPPPSHTQPTHTAPVPPPPPPPSAAEKAQATKTAQEQQDAFAKAREDAERKAAADRERVKAEAEAKMRAETETKMRAEAEAKIKAQAEAKAKAEADAKVKAAQDAAAKAAAEARAKAEAEAKKAREEADRARREAEAAAERARKQAAEVAERARKEAAEVAERARKEAEEKAERARKEAEEKSRREQEELKRKLEEERRAREEAERKAKEETERLAEERRKLEEERKRHEEARRREDEERTSRRIQEERERVERRKEEKARKKREEETEEEEKPRSKQKEPEPAPAPAPPPAAGGGFSDTLLADLDSFNTRDEQEQKEREEAARKEKEAAAARAREAEERRVKEEAARQEREEKQRRKQEEAESKAREEAELREAQEAEKRRLEEEEEKRKKEAEERARKAKQEERLVARAERSDAAAYTDESRLRSKRERELAAKPRSAAAARAGSKGWGKPLALTLFVLLVIALGVAHVMPIDTTELERAASEALGRPVKIGSARLSLFTGLQFKLSEVSLGEGISVPEVRAYPELDALLGPRKAFSRIEIERLKIEQDALGPVLFVKVKADNFSVGRIAARNVELTGPLALPRLEFEVDYGADGSVRSAVVRGPETLLARLTPKGSAIEFDMSANTFTLPFAPEISLSKFAAKGTATPQGLQVAEWDGALLNGTVSGTASVRWGESWAVEGVVTARNIYAAVFAPALLSDGRAEGSGKFSMRGPPGKLAATARIDGSFTVTRGVLGSIDLSRAIQTGGKVATGRTQFNEMNGQVTYDRGAVALRNITLGAGQLNAGASADIAENGALSGRIVADVKIAQQRLSATLNLGGTLKEPQVRN